jgi:hypothetical protein
MLLGIEAATMEVAVEGSGPRRSRKQPGQVAAPADENKCATLVITFKQFNFFESNGAKKPPRVLAAFIYGDLDAAFAYFGDPQLFGLGAADPGATIACFGNLELIGLGATGTSKWLPDPGGAGTLKCTPDPGEAGMSSGLRMRR